MFGTPVPMLQEDAVVHLVVWTYTIKAVNDRKKAQCVCNGLMRSGMVRILDETYANCVNQTSSYLFYAVSAAKNMLIYGANVSNAFTKAPPPKQGFFIRPNKAFHKWWVQHKKCPPIPDGYVIPILSAAMQGHPESPWLWEKHADSILCEIGLSPTVHEPCLYSGIINCQHVLFMRQVDNSAIASPDAKTADILLDMINKKLTIPVKRQGYLDMYNGNNVHQTRYYIKVSIRLFIDKVIEKHLATWMKSAYPSPTHSTPLPSESAFQKINSSTGNPDKKAQLKLAKDMQIGYCLGVRELIWAMTTCCPDLAYSSVKLSQSNSCPHKIHYHGLKHALKYLYHSKDDGLYFWRTQPRMELPKGPLPSITSNCQDLLLDNWPHFDATTAHANAHSD